MGGAEDRQILALTSLAQVQKIFSLLELGGEVPFPDKIVFSGELAAIELTMVGPDFHQTVPGAFARGLWGFQEEIYRAVAQALYDTNDLRKLSKEDIDNFNLVFKVNEGSSAFEAAITEFMGKLAEGLSNMSDELKLMAILGVAVVLVTGYAAVKIGQASHEAKIKQLEIDGQIRIEEVRSKAETERLAQTAKIVDAAIGTNPVVAGFKSATAEGTKQLVKAAPTATSASYGVVSFDEDAISEIRARSGREATDRVTIRDHFRVTGHKRQAGADIARFNLHNHDGEISAIVDLSDAGPLSAEQRARFWTAVQEQTPIYLQVIVSSRGEVVKQVVIDDMPDPDDEL